MGLFSRFENKAEDVIEGSGGSKRGGIEPVKLAKRAFKEMEREKMVGVGHEYAPTLYNVLVSAEDDERMNGFYPSLAGEIETYLTSRAEQTGLVFDCPPLVRFIVDEGLKKGRFDIIAESVSPAIISELRHEEMVHYGLENDDDESEPEPAPQPLYGSPDDYIEADPPQNYQPQAQNQNVPAYHYHQPDAPQNYEQAVESHYHPQQAQPQGEAYFADDANGYGQQPAYQQPAQQQPAYQQQERYQPQQQAYGQQSYQPQAAEFGGAAAAYAPQAQPTPQPQGSYDQHVPSAGETVMLDEPIPKRQTAVLYNYQTRQHYKLLTDRTTIGRETTCDVVISDPSVSRRHAEILHGANGWLIRDTGSTNGTTVNGTSTTQSRIYNGDIINLGNTQLEFQEG